MVYYSTHHLDVGVLKKRTQRVKVGRRQDEKKQVGLK